MFSGIVAGMGTVAARRAGSGLRLTLELDGVAPAPAVGGSVAVNGVCLTVVAADGGTVDVDVIPETLERTTLGSLDVGDRVNVEPSLRIGDPLDGHLVQGHVDGTGEVVSVSEEGAGRRMRISVPPSLERFVVEKGSVAVDGVSLTVAVAGEGWFEVALVPHTLEVTTLGLRRAGDPVNLESDVLAKYVQRLATAPERRGG